MNRSGKTVPGTQAVARAIALLKSFNDGHPEWGLSELAKENGLNKTTAYRLLAALENERFIIRNVRSGMYRLGPELIALGGCAMRSNDLRTVARPILESLAASTGETTTLEILVGSEVLILDEVSSRYLVGISQDVGSRLPAHATSTGKAMLAFVPDSDLTHFLDQTFASLTPKTIIRPHALGQALTQVRSQGYAVASEELEIGFVAIAAPIFDHQGMAIAAVSVGGPTVRLTAATVEKIGVQLRVAARQVSEQIGYRPR